MTFLHRLSPCVSFLRKKHLFFAPGLKLSQSWNSASFLTHTLDFHSSQKTLIETNYIRGSLKWKPDLTGAYGKHILWANLATLEYGCDEAIYEVNDDSFVNNRNVEYPKLAIELERFIKEDARKCPPKRIDSVLFYVDRAVDPPLEIWQALGGLCPKHLEICCSWYSEECHVKSLDALQHQWNNLETLCFEMLADSHFMDDAPAVFSRISRLSLVSCCGLNLIPPGVTRLRHLHISNDNATESFIWQIDSNPNIAPMLEVLDLQGMSGWDVGTPFEMPTFKECLEKCTNLHTLRLVVSPLDHLDNHIPSYLPPSIRNLTVCFPRSLTLLSDMDDWIVHVSDPMWLPHLKTFKLAVDPERPVRHRNFDKELEDPETSYSALELEKIPSREAFDSEFDGKRSVLYKMLKSSRPYIELRI